MKFLLNKKKTILHVDSRRTITIKGFNRIKNIYLFTYYTQYLIQDIRLITSLQIIEGWMRLVQASILSNLN